jgi:hypothetical protein
MDGILENRDLGVGEDGLEVASLAVDALLVGRVRVATFKRPIHGLSGQGKVLDLGPPLILIDLVVLEHHFVGLCPQVGVAPVVEEVRVDGRSIDLKGRQEHGVEEEPSAQRSAKLSHGFEVASCVTLARNCHEARAELGAHGKLRHRLAHSLVAICGPRHASQRQHVVWVACVELHLVHAAEDLPVAETRSENQCPTIFTT